MAIVAVVLSVLSLVVATAALFVAFRFSSRSLVVSSVPVAADETPVIELPSRPLEGMKVWMQVEQDHPTKPFLKSLEEVLYSEDVADVSPTGGELMLDGWKASDGPDLLICGRVACNGYSDVYYRAEFVCSTPEGRLCTLQRNPPHGDRPANLALELVAEIKSDLEKSKTRNERGRAIQELKG